MAGGARIIVQGHEALQSKLAEIQFQGKFITSALLKDMADRIYEESQFLVPVDTGALKFSGAVQQVSSPKFGSSGEWRVVYGSEDVINPRSGSPTSDYALIVHETHPDSPKFVEEPAERIFAQVESMAKARFTFLGRGGTMAKSVGFFG